MYWWLWAYHYLIIVFAVYLVNYTPYNCVKLQKGRLYSLITHRHYPLKLREMFHSYVVYERYWMSRMVCTHIAKICLIVLTYIIMYELFIQLSLNRKHVHCYETNEQGLLYISSRTERKYMYNVYALIVVCISTLTLAPLNATTINL